MDVLDSKKEIIQELIEKEYIISEEILKKLDDELVISIKKEGLTDKNLVLLGLEEEDIDANIEILNDLEKKSAESIEKTSKKEAHIEKKSDYGKEKLAKYKIKVIENYDKKASKKTVEDSSEYFYNRFRQLQKIISNNEKLDDVAAVSRIIGRKNERVSIIGMVYSIDETKKGNLLLEIEDITGSIKILINKNNRQLHEKGKKIVVDEVIGIKGKADDTIVYVDELIFANDKEKSSKKLKKYDKEAYGIFISDIHMGANSTYEEKFIKLIDWINGKKGTEAHKRLVKKIKYIFITGDLVEGLGVYPDQEKELLDKDVNKQYEKAYHILKQVPKDIAIIITPGNHDTVRLAEPQVSIEKSKYSEIIRKIDNVFLFSNPSTINILSGKDFEGFDMLLYHGYSFDYYFSNVESIRNAGGYDRGDLLLELLLEKRHLAPTYESTLIMPEAEKDYLAIEKLPDFFVTGHTHMAFAKNHDNITLISSGTFQKMTEFQKKFGHNPDVGKIVLTNFMTRENKVLKF